MNHAYDERGQMELGRYLYQQVFHKADPEFLHLISDDSEKKEIRIVTTDENISRIPWVLLADENGVFLTSQNCSISLSAGMECKDYEAPPSPRILIAMPQPIVLTDTQAVQHLEELEDMLSSADHLYYKGRHLNIVYTWEDFQEAVRLFQPDIVYYYGHGQGTGDASYLQFSEGKKQRLKKVSSRDFADCLKKNLEQPPLIAYINCCSGDSGSLLGLGRRLSNFIPAVITNRNEAYIDAAGPQAMAFWKGALIDGLPPHEAVKNIRYDLCRYNLSSADARWMTPVLHCSYGQWKTNPPQRVNRLEHDPYWRLKVDRVKQFGTVYYLTDKMLYERKPRCLAYLWYGAEGQGVDIFHHRLKIELRKGLKQAQFIEIRPEWPPELTTNASRSFEDMITEAFDVLTPDHIPARIRAMVGGRNKDATLVYVRHNPLRSTNIVTPGKLKTYIEWWDYHFSSIIPENAFVLLGVSYVLKNLKGFYDFLIKKIRINELSLNQTVFQLLDELKHLNKKDLVDFLNEHNIRLPLRIHDKVLEQIIQETNGEYENTLGALEDIVSRAWDLSEDDEHDELSEEDGRGFGADD